MSWSSRVCMSSASSQVARRQTIPVSTWLLAFTLFVCLSLALMKRFIEVQAQPTAVGLPVSRRGYRADDAQWLHSAGLAAAYLSVVILAIYVNNPSVSLLYAHSDRLLLVCPLLLYWSTRTWLRAASTTHPRRPGAAGGARSGDIRAAGHLRVHRGGRGVNTPQQRGPETVLTGWGRMPVVEGAEVRSEDLARLTENLPTGARTRPRLR